MKKFIIYVIPILMIFRDKDVTCLEIKKIPVLEVISNEAGTANLLCDISHPRNDKISLILFFSDNLTTPIYSYDLRSGKEVDNVHWKDASILGRVQLIVSSQNANLRISPVRFSDEGYYRCRVDYHKYPTKTSRMKLRVFAPSKSLKIFHDAQEVNSTIGPFFEGSQVILHCLENGGHPPPTVRWSVDGETVIPSKNKEKISIPTDLEHRYENATINYGTGISHLLESLPADVRRMTDDKRIMAYHNESFFTSLVIGPLTRDDFMTVVTCRSSQMNFTNSVERTLKINMYLAPILLDLTGPEGPVPAGKNYTFICTVIGSRPSPIITWIKGDAVIQGSLEEISDNGNETKSYLLITPVRNDDQATITCKAENKFTNTTLLQSVTISVNSIPEAKIRLAAFLDPSNIKEDDGVYFECIIKSKPAAYKVTWYHNSHLIEINEKNDVIISNQSLVLQNVRREDAGLYSCSASNLVGDGQLSSVNLDVKYSPVCHAGQKFTYGVAKNEDTEVICKVHSNPPAKSFKWTFNNTADTIEVPPGRYTTTPDSSIITYTPKTELDFGTLLCWATNSINVQSIPCAFSIIPADRPDSPSECLVTKKTSVSFEVLCKRGFDGGLPQMFHISVLTAGGVQQNFSSVKPQFKILNLLPGSLYRISVWSSNEKGVSAQLHMKAFTLSKENRMMTKEPSEFELREVRTTRAPPTEKTYSNQHMKNFVGKISFPNGQRTYKPTERDLSHLYPLESALTMLFLFGGALTISVVVAIFIVGFIYIQNRRIAIMENNNNIDNTPNGL